MELGIASTDKRSHPLYKILELTAIHSNVSSIAVSIHLQFFQKVAIHRLFPSLFSFHDALQYRRRYKLRFRRRLIFNISRYEATALLRRPLIIADFISQNSSYVFLDCYCDTCSTAKTNRDVTRSISRWLTGRHSTGLRLAMAMNSNSD